MLVFDVANGNRIARPRSDKILRCGAICGRGDCSVPLPMRVVVARRASLVKGLQLDPEREWGQEPLLDSSGQIRSTASPREGRGFRERAGDNASGGVEYRLGDATR